MSNPSTEFNNFLESQWDSFSEYERKLANIIVNNFDSISQKGSAAGARSRLLSELIQKHGQFVETNLPVDSSLAVNNPKIQNLQQLIIRNFRGFTEEKTFDLSKQYTFVYGANGTGKSSFIDALEYCLTGEIFEAKSKRFDVVKYIQNKMTRKSYFASLNVKNEDGKTCNASKNSAINRFMFIERNRIEGFARISSSTKQIKQQQLSALFGLDEFNGFCNGFNTVTSLNNYLPLTPLKANALIVKRKDIESAKIIVETKKSAIKGYESRKNNLLGKYTDCSLVSQVLKKIEGKGDVVGLLPKKKEELENIKKTIQKKDITKLDLLLENTYSLKVEYEKYLVIKKDVDTYKDTLSLVNLYKAISYLDNNTDNSVCPACRTPLENTVKNPFIDAKEKLLELESISKKEQESLRTLSILKNTIIKIQTKLSGHQIKNTLSIESFYNDLGVIDKETLALKNSWNKYNEENKLKLEAINRINIEVSTLEEDKTEAKTLYELFQSNVKEKKEQEKIISDFEKNNAQLINEVAEEEKSIIFYNHFSFAYNSLTTKLHQYSDSLPSKLIVDLEALTLEFYNSINHHDYTHEVLKSIKLPQKPSGIIEIEYLDGLKDNALRVLSEGHLRCLGLSILLAKNAHDKHNLIIFDDVVNAIDDEHRLGVIKTFFTNANLNEKQMILTTHGEDFLKTLENQFAKQDLKDILSRYDFLKNYEGREIIVNPDLHRHYLSKAKENLRIGFEKDCLMECRRSLEELSHTLWKKIANDTSLDSSISIQLRSPKGNPELSSIVNGLISRMKKFEKTGANKFTPHKEFLEKITNTANKNRIFWDLLNKGTHEEERDEEFDRNSIDELLQYLLKFESLLKSK